jgi:hypothetical protein
MTLAHESGHGCHDILAYPQGILQFHPPLTLAETASIFGEMIVFRDLLDKAPGKQVGFCFYYYSVTLMCPAAIGPRITYVRVLADDFRFSISNSDFSWGSVSICILDCNSLLLCRSG